MCSNRFPPTIADIRAKAVDLNGQKENGALEAWALVYKAICNSAYNSEEEFAKLPVLCRKAVGRPENLKEWSLMDIATVQSVEQSHFIRSYNTLLAGEREAKGLIPQDREKIGMTGENITITEKKGETREGETPHGGSWTENAQEKYERLVRELEGRI